MTNPQSLRPLCAATPSEVHGDFCPDQVFADKPDHGLWSLTVPQPRANGTNARGAKAASHRASTSLARANATHAVYRVIKHGSAQGQQRRAKTAKEKARRVRKARGKDSKEAEKLEG